MAKIPTGNFGFRTPQGQDVTPMAQLDTQVGDAAQRLGGTAAAIGGSMLAEQKAESDRLARQAENVQVMTAHATIQNGLNDAYRAVDTDVLEGKTDKLGALSTWKDQSAKVVADNLKGLPPERAALVNAQLGGLQGQLEGKLFTTFRKRDQQDVAGGLVTMREQLERFANTDPSAAVKQYNTALDVSGRDAGLTPEQISKQKATFSEQVTFNQFRRAGQAAMQTGSIEAIDEVQKRLAGQEGDALDPAKRNTLDQTLFGWKASIEARQARQADKAEREETKRFNTATDTLNKNRDIALAGGFIAPEQIALIAEQTQGIPELQTQARELFESQKAVAGFASMPPNKRAEVLEGARAGRADPKVGIDPLGEKQLNRAEQIDASLRKKVDDGEAWSAAQSVGVIPAAPLIEITNPQQALAAFQTRMANIGSVEAWAGKKVSPLQPPEAEQVTRMLRALKPDAAASMLGQLGAVIGDSDRIAAVAKQIGDKDGTLGTAMAYASAKTTEGRYTAELILQGDQMIKDKAVRIDGAVETGWRGAIAKQVRGAYSNQQVESQIIDAAFKIAAAKNGDVDNAINLATGGIIERNGGKIPLPYGMKEREFEKRVSAITPENLVDQTPGGVVIVGPTRMPVADFVKTLPDARLVHAGQGAYNVRAGNQLVTNERGQRITLKVAP